MICRRYLVSGRVQGVWYRGATQQQARRLGLTGYAINLDDGRVEVVACGAEAAVDELACWLKEGPEMAVVSEVSCEPWNGESFAQFSIG